MPVVLPPGRAPAELQTEVGIDCNSDSCYYCRQKEKGLLWFVGTNGLEIILILMNGMMACGHLSTGKVIDPLYIGWSHGILRQLN